jgi:hypothetical protein
VTQLPLRGLHLLFNSSSGFNLLIYEIHPNDTKSLQEGQLMPISIVLSSLVTLAYLPLFNYLSASFNRLNPDLLIFFWLLAYFQSFLNRPSSTCSDHMPKPLEPSLFNVSYQAGFLYTNSLFLVILIFLTSFSVSGPYTIFIIFFPRVFNTNCPFQGWNIATAFIILYTLLIFAILLTLLDLRTSCKP